MLLRRRPCERHTRCSRRFCAVFVLTLICVYVIRPHVTQITFISSSETPINTSSAKTILKPVSGRDNPSFEGNTPDLLIPSWRFEHDNNTLTSRPSQMTYSDESYASDFNLTGLHGRQQPIIEGEKHEDPNRRPTMTQDSMMKYVNVKILL